MVSDPHLKANSTQLTDTRAGGQPRSGGGEGSGKGEILGENMAWLVNRKAGFVTWCGVPLIRK